MKVNDITLFALSHCFKANWKRIIFLNIKSNFKFIQTLYRIPFGLVSTSSGLQNVPIVNNKYARITPVTTSIVNFYC